MDSPNHRHVSLSEIEKAIWVELTEAVTVHGHAWRTPVVATVNGDAADARVVVLREIEVREKRLIFYTDERAGKVAQLLKNPRGSVVLWSRPLGWQVRCQVRMSLEMSGLAATSRWAKIRLTKAAQDYLSAMPPGTPLTEIPHVARAAVAVPRDYFSVISADVQQIDWLELHPDGNRRAVFDADGSRWI